MKPATLQLIALPCLLLAAAGIANAQPKDVLPPGVRAVWDLNKAQRDTTPTRERVCLNGLWRFQPAKSERRCPADRSVGLLQGPGVLARPFQLHPGRHANPLQASKLEG